MLRNARTKLWDAGDKSKTRATISEKKTLTLINISAGIVIAGGS
jgi:hypothetical protein